MSIRVNNVTKRFGSFVALDDVSLDVPEGTLLALLGPSGCGKTSLLRIIAGLDFADKGAVHVHDDDITGRSARERNMGFVFQHYALFRHMSVFENVAFGLRVRGWKTSAIQDRVRELLRLVRLDSLERSYPAQLSGGQRQRVALARALAAQPRVLLLDEPFGALDAKVRKELRQWLRRLHDDLHVTTIFVTHDQEEAFEVADRVIVMRAGRIEQGGTPQEIFDNPASAFVMDFLGQVNVFHGRAQNGKAILGALELEYPEHPHNESSPVQVYVRPHDLEIHAAPVETASLKARVLHVNPLGPVTRIQLIVPEFGLEINVDVTPARYAELRLQKGDAAFVSPRNARVFVPDYAI